MSILVLLTMTGGCGALMPGSLGPGVRSEPAPWSSDEASCDQGAAEWSSGATSPTASASAPRIEGAADSHCSFGDCGSDGWSTSYPDGSRSTTRCSFGDCNANGWTTTTSSGETITCRCNFGDCNANGVDCD